MPKNTAKTATSPTETPVADAPVADAPVADAPAEPAAEPAAEAPAEPALPQFQATTYDLIHPVTRVRFGQGYGTPHELDDWVKARLETHWLKQVD